MSFEPWQPLYIGMYMAILQVYGSIEQYDGYDRFEFQHSYSQVFPPGDKYTPDGVFMSFEYYNVEDRNRVKCISGVEGEFKSPLLNFLLGIFVSPAKHSGT